MKTRVLYLERKPGGSVSIERVFRQIAKDLPADEFEVSFQSVPYGDGILNVLKNLLLFCPKAADIYHVTGHVTYLALVLPRKSTVVTIHDLILMHIRSGLRRSVLKKLYFDWPVRRSRYSTAISDTTHREMIEILGEPAQRTTVIEDPLIDGFDPEPMRPFNSERTVILHVGTAGNKNLPRLISAVTHLDVTLRIIGELDGDVRTQLQNSGVRFESRVGLDPSEMTEEYRGCDIVSFCSTYEGFGLPIIEAQAMRKPLLTSDLDPMRSVAADGALLVDPFSVEAIRVGLERVIGDPSLRAHLIERGSENVRRFHAAVIALKYAQIYREIKANTEGSR